jgi:hypothetical protein
MNLITLMTRALLLIIGLFIFSCGQRNHINKVENQRFTSDEIIGAWGNDENGNAIFQIDKDSILYVDPLTKYKYSLANDTLKIFDNGFINKLIVLRADSDSLILNNLNYSVIQRYNKRK